MGGGDTMDLHRENSSFCEEGRRCWKEGPSAALGGRPLSLVSPVAGRYRDTLAW